MLSKLETLAWYLKRPSLYPQLFQLVRRLFNRKKECTKAVATSWCEEVAVSKEEALKKLGINKGLIHPKEDFGKIWRLAEKRANSIPVVMGGAGAIDVLYTIILHFEPQHVLETGVAYGWSSLAILLALKKLGRGVLVSIDMPYPKMGNEPYVGIVVPEDLRENWHLLRLPDVVGVPKALKILNEKVDLFHYDSDKSYTGRMTTYPLVWEKLSSGGIFISDDIGDNIAFKEFAEHVGVEPIVFEWHGKFVGILRKS